MGTPIPKFSTAYTVHRYGAVSVTNSRKDPESEVFQAVQNEAQVFSLKLYQGPNPSAGSIRLNWDGVDAGWVAWPGTLAGFASAIQTALNAIPALIGNVAASSSTVTDSAGNVSANVTVTFQGSLQHAPQLPIVLTDGGLTANGQAVWGYWSQAQPGIAANTPLSFKGSFQPLNPREVALLPEGERATEKAKFYTEATLHMLDQEAKTPADVIDARGRQWQVQNITTYQQELGPPYFKCMLNLVEVD